MGISVAQAIDLVTASLPQIGEMKVTDLTDTVTKRVAMKLFMKKKYVTVDSGDRIEFSVLTESDNNARHTKLHEVDNTTITPGVKRGYVDWRFTSTSYAFDRRELKINQGKAKILDIIKTRRNQMFIGLSKLLENTLWSCPAAGDDETPNGLFYYIVRNASKGHNGGAPSGYTTVAGLNPTTDSTMWKNYTDTYAVIDEDDFVDMLCEAETMTGFESEIEGISDYSTGDDKALYANYRVLAGVRKLARAQNENLGRDIAEMHGKGVFHGIPFTYVPKLQADATDPIYGVNHGTFKTVFMEGEVFKEGAPERAPNQHNDVIVPVDLQYNWVCYDRKQNFVAYKV